MNGYRKPVIAATLLCSMLAAGMRGGAQQPAQPGGIWPRVEKQTKPWTRWWWMGSAVDESNISRQLAAFDSAGLGGVEIVPIYGAVGFEKQYIPYLSPRWMQMLDHTVQKARTLNMGVDISVGTGWPIGGPQVTLPHAASNLIIQKYALQAGQALTEKIVVKDARQKGLPGVGLAALMAYGEDGSVLDVTGKVDTSGTLAWKPVKGAWQLYAAFVGKTRQQVKRAAPGGEGYTLDHFSKASITAYLSKFDTVFGPTLHGARSFYNDSYEVYNADWSPVFFDEFRRRRGYDLKPFINTFSDGGNSDKTARLKSDYRETMSDLMLDNFTRTFTSWAHRKKAFSLNQAHGSPGNLLDLYAAVDIPEAETFGSSYFPIPGLRRDSGDVRNVDPDPNMLKFASSAAHAMGHPLASSETFTWLTEHFKTSWSQCKPEVEQVFLSGINHVFFHGTTYSPANVPWPGWLFYASVNFVPANSLWPHLNGLNNYITRCQSVLQSGKPDNEIMMYWPVYDAWNNPKGMDMPFKVHDIDVWLHPSAFYKNVVQLQRKGYSIDFVSDRMIGAASVSNGMIRVADSGASHQVLVVPQCTLMPVATLQSMLALAKSGATVIIQQLPADVPGWNNLEAGRKALKSLLATIRLSTTGANMGEMKTGRGRIIVAADVQQALEYAGIARESLADSGLKFIRRAAANGRYYYLVNHTANPIDTLLPLQTVASSVVIMDPQTGDYGLAPASVRGNATWVRLQLRSGEAMIVQALRTGSANIPAWQYTEPAGPAIALQQEWRVHFSQGGPVPPRDTTISTLQSWTRFADSAAQDFSGTAVYSTDFTLPATIASDYLLRLEKVNESAKVWINGQEAGLLWSIPYEARVGKYLHPGSNSIRIEVANLMANRIRYMDRHGIKWRNYHEINFVNIDYKDFNAAVWQPQPSGLTGPVTLVPLRVNNSNKTASLQ